MSNNRKLAQKYLRAALTHTADARNAKACIRVALCLLERGDDATVSRQAATLATRALKARSEALRKVGLAP